MRHTALCMIGIAFLCAFQTAPTQAQPTRVFVAAQGSDNNPCTFALPCRTFQHAHNAVAAGGEIDVLDPAGYGTLTITKSISIQGHGFSGVTVPGGSFGTGITINAGPSDVVNLSGLIIEGAGMGEFGLFFVAGGSLTIEQCVVRNLVKGGLMLDPAFSSTIAISDTYVANTNPGGGYGIRLQPTGATTVTATFNRVELYKNGLSGLFIDASASTGIIKATVVDSVAAYHSLFGFSARSFGASVTVSYIRSTATHNGDTGFFAEGQNASILVGQSTATHNSAAPAGAVSSATMRTYGDNYFDGAGCIGCTAIAKQ